MSLRCIAFSLFAWLALCAAAEARPRQAPSAPHVLPAAGASAARSEPATWLVGTRLTPATRAIARAHAARLLSPRGVFVVERDRARPFALALQAAGTYRFAEPDVRLRAAKREDGTEWRPALLGSLQPPPVEQAPLTAVIDASVDAGHPELAGIRVAGDPAVTDAHGTAVASMITGRGNGVFPGAPVLAIGKSLRTSDLTAGIAEAVKADARIINMSFGGPDPNYAMYVEIAYAVSQGVLCVAAAGNDYYTVLEDGTVNPVMYPAAYPHVLSVSSLGPAGASSDFSTANGAVDLAAPGEGVLAAVPVALDDDGVPDGYQRLDGTSFSAPIVAGTAAWLMTARPDLGARQAADVLRFSATDVDDPGWDSDTGYGQVNLAAALSEPAPQVDKLEVDDDVEWVDGSRFNKPDPYFYRGFIFANGLQEGLDVLRFTAPSAAMANRYRAPYLNAQTQRPL